MSKVFAARFSIIGAGPLPTAGEFEVFGDVVDQSLDGFSVSDVAAGDSFFDENLMNGNHNRYVVLSVINTGPSAYWGAGPNSIHLYAKYEDAGAYDENGPAASEGIICRTSSFGMSEIPPWTIQGISEAITTRARNIDMRQVIDPSLGGGGGGNQLVEELVLSSTNLSDKNVQLLNAPADPTKVVTDVIGGTSQGYGEDYTVSGSVLSWSGLGLDGALEVGDVLRVSYFY